MEHNHHMIQRHHQPPPPPQYTRPSYNHRSSGGGRSYVQDDGDDTATNNNDHHPQQLHGHVIHSRSRTQSHGLSSRARSRSKGRKPRRIKNQNESAPHNDHSTNGAMVPSSTSSGNNHNNNPKNSTGIPKSRRSSQEDVSSTSNRRGSRRSSNEKNISRNSSYGDLTLEAHTNNHNHNNNSSNNNNSNEQAVEGMMHQGKIDSYGRCTRHPTIELCRRETHNNKNNGGAASWRILLQDCPLCSLDDSAGQPLSGNHYNRGGQCSPSNAFMATATTTPPPPPPPTNKTVDSTQTAATATTEEASSVRSWTVSDASSSEDEGNNAPRKRSPTRYQNGNDFGQRFKPSVTSPTNATNLVEQHQNNQHRFSPQTSTPPPRRSPVRERLHGHSDERSKKSTSRRRGSSRSSRRSVRSTISHRKSASAGTVTGTGAAAGVGKSSIQSLKDLGKRFVMESEGKSSSSMPATGGGGSGVGGVVNMTGDDISIGGRSQFSLRSNPPPPPSRTKDTGRSHQPPPIGVSKRSSFHKEDENTTTTATTEGGITGSKRSGGNRKDFNTSQTSLSSLSAKEISELRRQRLAASGSGSNTPQTGGGAGGSLTRMPPPRRATCDVGVENHPFLAAGGKATDNVLGEASTILSRIERHMSDQRSGSFNAGNSGEDAHAHANANANSGANNSNNILSAAAEARARAKQNIRRSRKQLMGESTTSNEGLSAEWEEPMSQVSSTDRARRNVDRTLEHGSRGRDETAVPDQPVDDILGAAAAIRNRARRSLSRSRERCREAAIFCGEAPLDDGATTGGDDTVGNESEYSEERALVEVKRSILNPHGLLQPEVPVVERRSQSRGRSGEGRAEPSPGRIRHGSRGRERGARDEDVYGYDQASQYDDGNSVAESNAPSSMEALLQRRREMRQKIAERQNAARSKKDRPRADSTEYFDQEGYQSGGGLSGDGQDSVSLKQQVLEEWGNVADADKKSVRSGRSGRREQRSESTRRGRSRSAMREGFSRIRSASLRALGKKGSKLDLDNLPPAGRTQERFDDNSTIDTGRGSKSSFARRLSMGKNTMRSISRGKSRGEDSNNSNVDLERRATRSESFVLGTTAWDNSDEDKHNRSFLKRIGKSGGSKFGRSNSRGDDSQGFDDLERHTARSFTQSDSYAVNRIAWEAESGDLLFAPKSKNIRSLSRGSARDDSDARSVRSAAKSESFAMNRKVWEDNDVESKSSRSSLFKRISGKVKDRSRSRGRRGSFRSHDEDFNQQIDYSARSDSFAMEGSPWENIPSRASGSSVPNTKRRSKMNRSWDGASSEIVRKDSSTNPFMD